MSNVIIKLFLKSIQNFQFLDITSDERVSHKITINAFTKNLLFARKKVWQRVLSLHCRKLKKNFKHSALQTVQSTD